MYIFGRKRNKIVLTEGIVRVSDEIIDTVYREILKSLYLYKKNTNIGSLIKDTLKLYKYSSDVSIDKVDGDYVFSFYKDNFKEFDQYKNLPDDNEIILVVKSNNNEHVFEFLKPNIIMFYPNSEEFDIFTDQETIEIMRGQVKHEIIHYINNYINPNLKQEDDYYNNRKRYLMSKVEYESLISDQIENFLSRYKKYINVDNKTDTINRYVRGSEFFKNYKKDYPLLYKKAILKFTAEVDKHVNFELSNVSKVKFNKLRG